MQDLSEIVRRWSLRPAGHVLRLPENRPASLAYTMEFSKWSTLAVLDGAT